MKDLLYQIGLQLLQNIFDAVKKYEVAGTGVLLFAIIASADPRKFPKTLQDWWFWIITALQSAIPIRQHPSLPQVQIQQETPQVKTVVKEELPKLD